MHNAFLKYLVLVFLAIVLASNIQCQFIYDTLLLSELEVIGNLNDVNSTTKVTTIDSIKRSELNLQDIGELLAAFTPVFVKSYGRGSLSTVSFRGTGASHTKVLWEGFNINSPMLGQTDFSLLPGSFFNEVELNYGGGSLTGISGALGGSVSLKSNIDPNSSIFNIHQSVGSFSTYLTSAVLNLKKERISSSTHFVRQSSLNNFQYYNNAILPVGKEMIQTDADFVVTGFTQQLAYTISGKQQIKFITWNQWNNRTIPMIMTNIEKGGNHMEWQKDFFSRNIIQWELNNSKTQWEAKASYFHEELDYYLQTSDTLETTISLIDSKNRVESYSLLFNVSSEVLHTFILKAGIESLQEQVVSNNYIDKKQRNKLSSYISLKKSFKKKFTVEALARAELSDSEFIPLMPMFGIVYKPLTEHDLHIRANVSRNYNLPSLNDLYWYPGGNEDLKPEQSLQAEAGLDYSIKLNDKNLLKISGSTYTSSVSNWIIWLPGDYRYWSPENIAKVLSRGTELSCQIKGMYRNVAYSFFGEYAYTRTTNNSDSAKISGVSEIQLIYVPKHTINGFLNINARGYYANWSLSFTGSRNTSLNNDENYSFTLPSYMVNNISIGKKFELKKVYLDIRFKIYNVFNVDYQAVLWRAMPGRNFEISLNCKI